MVFIGTGSGITSLKRFHTSFLFSFNNYNLLVDAGDGISRALLQSGIDFSKINSIVFSHFHPDHLNGISSLLVQMKMNKRTNKLRIFVHYELNELFLKFLEINYIFKLRLGFELEIISFNTDEFCSITDDCGFTARENHHLTRLSDYVKPGDKSLISCGFVFKIDGKNILYPGDVGGKDDLHLFDDFSIDYMICESSHVDLQEIFPVFRRLNAKHLLITHISDDIEPALNNWYNMLDEKEKQSVIVTRDGLTLEL